MNIFTRTIHPAPNYNTQWTTAIHGLTYDKKHYNYYLNQ